MSQTSFASAALIAAAVFTSQAVSTGQAAAAHNHHLAARHHPTKAYSAAKDAFARDAVAKDCVRAPKVGAFATDPWTEPPCMPNTATDAFQ